jgi:hypothetical protein
MITGLVGKIVTYIHNWLTDGKQSLHFPGCNEIS